jgi:hypothetical protein
MADRPRAPQRRWPSVATPLLLGVGASLSSVTGLGAWLMLTDPAVAADVAATGELMPLVQAMFETLRAALADWLAYL